MSRNVDAQALGLPSPVHEALNIEPVSHVSVIDGCEISWLSWGNPANRTVIFVHGGAAHARWWSFTAPLLADRFHVIALDLAGHGDSGRRTQYGFERWADDIRGVLRLQRSAAAPIIVAHSMGGVVTSILAAAPERDRIGAVVIVDTPLRAPTAEEERELGDVLGKPRRYATREIAVSSFRLVPAQELASASLLRLVAAHSVRPVSNEPSEWTWKYDPHAFVPHDDRPSDVGALLEQSTCPVAIIVGGASAVVPNTDRERMRSWAAQHPHRFTYSEIADGHHHLMFDKPVELITEIDRLVSASTRPAAHSTVDGSIPKNA